MCLQTMPVSKESKIQACRNQTVDIGHSKKETSVSQVNNNIAEWRKGGSRCKIQPLYKRKSRLPANSRINIRKKHITYAALRHGTYTHARGRGGDATGAGGHRNTCPTQSVGPYWRVTLEHRKSVQGQRFVPKIVQQLTSSRRLPSCFLNVNTNAGITDTSEKIEAKQASCTSVHSSDQYFSTHTDTPDGRVMDSDNEVSPSFSFTEDAGEKVVLSPHSNSDPVLSESCDQVIQLRQVDNKDKRREIGETSRHRGHKKSAEEASNEDNVDIKAEKHLRTNPGVLSAVQDDQQTNKHKKKTKTTETVYIKFESSLSKKVTTTTTLLKDGKRQGTNKSKSDTHKQLPPLDDAQKAICNAPEKVDHRMLVEVPRHTKIVRCSDGPQESPDEMMKCNEDIIWLGVGADESSHKKASQNVVRATESEDHLQHFRTPPQSSCTRDTAGTASSMSERITSQRSPTKPHAPKSCVEARPDHLDSDYASERESSAATIVNVPKVSPRTKTAPIREGKEQAARHESVNKFDKTKQTDSPLREHRSIQEKKEQSKHASPNKEPSGSRVETKGHDHSQTAASLLSRTESPKLESSTTAETSSRKRSTAKHKGDSPQKKSPLDIIAKLESKKVISSKVRSRTTDDQSTKDDTADHPKGKSLQQPSTCSRKRSPARTKTQSRSPDSKRRKRSAKKSVDIRSSKSPDFWKSLDKSKRVKSADKTVDKKKKKKKQKQKATGKSEADSSHKLSSSKKETASSRSRSIESNKTSQTLSSSTSAPQFVEDVSLAQQISPGGYWKGEDGKLLQQGERCNGGMLDRDNSTKPRETKVKNRAAASAENVSMSEGTTKPIRAAESVPTFTGTVYTSITKVVQVASCPKVKKSEKDLQQAELGWNSSTLSAEEKAAAEKLKQNQRKVKARYFLMRSKSRSNESEQATAKGKRPMPRRNQADGDNGACEVSDNSDSPQPEKTKLGQGKSVQFSESTEDHEASREETTDEGSAYQQSDENDVALPQTGDKFTIVLQPSGKTIILPQPIQKPTTISAASGKPTADTPKPVNKSDADASGAPNKPTMQKREEQRSQTTPPRKRRPIWQKKPPKEKALTNIKAPTAAVKTVAALVPVKQRQSSDNILKPPARLNLGFLYPGKSKAQSPSFSNISLDDKRAVAYNTWMNGNILAAPMNKATRKLVAKTGSPVDIKEIIEGSSVDAADYHRSMRALHELGVRAAKSVPALGPRRTTSTDVVGSKRIKLPPGFQKKNKVHESSSARSLSSVDGADQQGLPSKSGAAGRDTSISPVSSSDVDSCPGLKYRVGSNRLTEQGYPRKGKEKRGKKFKDASGKWHAVKAQDVHSVPDLTRVQYYGDVTDFNALNMGLSWMVQSVFSRLPFLNQRQASSANASGDMPAGHGGE